MPEVYCNSTSVSRWRTDGCHTGTCIANLTFDHWSDLYLLWFSIDADMLTYVKHLWKRVSSQCNVQANGWMTVESGLYSRQEHENLYHWHCPDRIWEIGFLPLLVVKNCAPFFRITFFCVCLAFIVFCHRQYLVCYMQNVQSRRPKYRRPCSNGKVK